MGLLSRPAAPSRALVASSPNRAGWLEQATVHDDGFALLGLGSSGQHVQRCFSADAVGAAGVHRNLVRQLHDLPSEVGSASRRV